MAVFLMIGKYMAPGSNVYAELYEFRVDEGTLIESIKNFKKRHPEFNSKRNDGTTELDPYYSVFLYMPHRQISFSSFLDPVYTDRTILKLVAVYRENNDTTFQLINKDINRISNTTLKENFEHYFLDSLEIPYEKKGNSMKIGFIQL